MPFNLLLLPLLGGFIFFSKWNRSRYYGLRSDGYRLILYSAITGAVFFVHSRFAGRAAKQTASKA